MTTRRKRHSLLMVLMLPIAVLVGQPCWRVCRELWQEWIDSALITAVKDRKSVEVVSLLRQGANVNTREIVEAPHTPYEHLTFLFDRLRGRRAVRRPTSSALMLAVSEDETAITLTLLKWGATGVNDRAEWSPPYSGEYADPLLVIAADHGNVEIVRALLDRGAHTEDSGGIGMPALLAASDLFDRKVPPAERATLSGRYLAILRLLLDHGANMKVDSTEHLSVLCDAVSQNQTEAVAFLLDRGADPNDYPGWMLLQRAMGNDNIEIMKMLLARGAHINNEHHPLLRYTSDVKYLRFLLDHGADIHAGFAEHEADGRGEVGLTALIQAAGENELPAVRFLLSRGAGLKEHTEDGTTALMMAAQKARPEMVRYLLDRGAEVDVRNKWGHTALDFAAKNADKNVVALLKSRGGKR